MPIKITILCAHCTVRISWRLINWLFPFANSIQLRRLWLRWQEQEKKKRTPCVLNRWLQYSHPNLIESPGNRSLNGKFNQFVKCSPHKSPNWNQGQGNLSWPPTPYIHATKEWNSFLSINNIWICIERPFPTILRFLLSHCWLCLEKFVRNR